MSAPLHGVLARFADPEALVRAVQAARAAGYRELEGFTPYRVDGLGDALGYTDGAIRRVVLAAGVAGALGGFALQYLPAVYLYPVNSGDRPLNSWPAFVPVIFELTILAAAASAVLGMLFLNGLPMPYHPVFNVRSFVARSSTDFFLAIWAADPQFEADAVRALFRSLGAQEVCDVEP